MNKALSDEEKAKLASEKLEKQIGNYVSAHYGYPGDFSKEIQYFLVVYSNNKKLKVPSEFEGYKVLKRSIPRPLSN
jgi:hypothetical protein